jgi:dihydrofolate reductase
MSTPAAPSLTLIAAVARNRVIGKDNGLPWHLPEDLRHFRELTRGQPVIMGRKTWESLPAAFRPLPDRENIVVSRGRADFPGARRAASLDEALRLLAGAPTAFVIGGAQLYALALPRATRLELTEIDAEIAGDAWFPAFDPADWQETARLRRQSADGLPFAFVSYRRRQP